MPPVPFSFTKRRPPVEFTLPPKKQSVEFRKLRPLCTMWPPVSSRTNLGLWRPQEVRSAQIALRIVMNQDILIKMPTCG